MHELLGQGSDTDRAETKSKIRAAQAERAAVRAEVARLGGSGRKRSPVTEETVREVLDQFGALLVDANPERLGEDAVYRAASLFRRLVGERVWVDVDIRVGRKRGVVRARFTPRLLSTVADTVGAGPAPDPAGEIVVWLRRPPQVDLMAPEARRLYEEEKLGFLAIGKALGIVSQEAYRAYKRYYEMQGLPVPPRRPPGRYKRSD